MRLRLLQPITLTRLLVPTLIALAGPGIASAQTDPTFSRDVAPILFENCVTCHREGEIGPMPLTSYAEVAPFATLIAQYVEQRIMPPWGADPGTGTFANDPSLSSDQIQTITRWVAAGTPEGNRAELPDLPEYTDGWRMADPDVVLTNRQVFEVLPTGRSVYQNAMIATGFERDTFIQGSEVRPALKGFTHHANVYATIDGVEHRVAGYTPGGASRNYPPGVAKLIPAGTELRLNMHYNPKGLAHVDPGTSFAFRIADEPVRQIAYTEQTGNGDIDIPPGAANYELIGSSFVFEQDSHLISFMPRMNERGKDFKYILAFPDGTERVVLSVPRFNHGWIFTYELAEPLAAPAGSRLYSVAHWDNSPANPHNPDPTARIQFGPEIMNGYFEYTLDGQDLANDRLLSSH